MIRRALLLATLAIAASPAAHADYAVLKSGVRVHITGYELLGEHMLLTIPGGEITVPAADIASIEPEDVFTKAAAPPSPDASTGQFDELIRAAAAKHGVDERLITLVIATESNFNPRAVSRKSAQGLMQLLPQTAAQYSVSNVFDPAQNIEGGTHYLKDLLDRYRGDLRLALAAYNAGPELVDRYGGVPPIAETQSYVRRITANLAHEKGPFGNVASHESLRAR
jgi:soluble lytic murein transglycosylase-like protein